MTDYLIAPAARQDMLKIVSYIAARDSAAATRVRNALLAAFDRLSQRPALGHVRRDLTDLPVRFWTVARRYAVVYRGEGWPHRDRQSLQRGPGHRLASWMKRGKRVAARPSAVIRFPSPLAGEGFEMAVFV